MKPFTYNALPARVVFGSGTIAEVATEIRRLGCSRALMLSTRGQKLQIEKLASRLGELCAGVFSEAAMHTPIEISEKAVRKLQKTNADCVVALGGGSTTGLGKAIALRTGVPQIVIPTTYAGSEVTPILGETEAGVKRTLRSPDVLPETVIYDVDLTMSLTVPLTVTSGINAMAHAVEALYAKDGNPLTSLLAEQGLTAMSKALPQICQDPANKAARTHALYAAWACGTCLGTVGMALHHKLCHTLGGTFNLPHSETHTVVLPYAIAFNCRAAPEAMHTIARALGVEDPARGMYELAKSLGAVTSLRELGMAESAIEEATDLAMANPYWNPEPLTRDSIQLLLRQAYAGESPRSLR
jgi:alcohol dehydrogenase class IV